MIWLRLIGLGSWLKNAAGTIAKYIRLYPREAIIIALLALFAWTMHGKRVAINERDKARDEIAALIEASNANRLAAERQVKERQAALDKLTKDASHEHEQAMQGARTATDAYIRSHRLRPDCGISAAPALAEGKDSGVPAGVQADTGMVAIRETDLQALVDWLAIGVSAHNQAVDKVNAGLAIPDPALGH